MNDEKILIYLVEDDDWFAMMVSNRLSNYDNFEIKHFRTGKELLTQLKIKSPDLIVLDYNLETHTDDKKELQNGMEIMEAMKQLGFKIPTILLSGQEDIQTAVDLLKFNGIDYIVKDDSALDRLENSISKILEFRSIKQNINKLEGKLERLQKGLMLTAGALIFVVIFAVIIF